MPQDKWSKVLIKATELDFMVKQNEKDHEVYRQLSNKFDDISKKRDALRDTINRCSAIYKDVQQNLDEKKQHSLDRYKDAIEHASTLVRNSDISGARLKVDGNRAVIVTEHGHDVNEREGGALRTIEGILMQYTSIITQAGAIPIMVLDESFFALSDNTSEEMKESLRIFSENMLIIGIEQRDSIFANIDGVQRYEFVKEKDKKTKIRKEE